MKTMKTTNAMKTIPTLLAAGLLGLGLVQAEKAADPKARELNPDFTPALYRQLKDGEDNVFFSPYSITEAMAMVHAGAGGNTATEIAKAMALGECSAGDIAQRSGSLRAQMAKLSQGENKLRVANALCVTGVPPLEAYKELVRTCYEGELFSGGLDEINGWVNKKTEGRIEKTLEELSPDSACVILNAVYFKGIWQTPFADGGTVKAKFQRKPGESVDVDMMSREGSYPVLQDKGVIAVELLYGNGASMVLVIPGKADGMAALEEQLSAPFMADLCADLRKTQPKEINLSVPKFKVSTKYDLIPAMKELGVKDAFRNADFSPMFGRSGFTIAQIVHKATLEVDEKGSVASAATAVDVENFAEREPPMSIRFDRPFLVLIRDNASGTTLFMGRINDPTAK